MNAAGVLFLAFLIVPTLASAAPDQTSEAGFLLAPGDTLKLDILDDDKEPIDLPIAPDGSIQAPYLGAVKVAGLSVADALGALNARYVERQIFVVPKLGLSVAAYRPIFVIGDVKQPGSYPFQWQLNVEKAIGLAGGQITAGTTEDPVLARARLRAQLDGIDTDIIREALAFARLTALLADRKEILDEDIPPEARPYMDGPIAQSMHAVELRILATDFENFDSQKAILTENIAEAERGVALVEQLLEKVTKSVEFSQADVERARGLMQRGIKTMTEVSSLERQRTSDEARQLQVLSELSAGRHSIGTLKSQIAQLEQNRQMQALVDLQAHNAELAKAIASRRATEEQMMLLSNLSAEEMAKNREITLSFTIRRTENGETVDLPAAASTLLAPGDVVVVRIENPDGGSSVAALKALQPPVSP